MQNESIIMNISSIINSTMEDFNLNSTIAETTMSTLSGTISGLKFREDGLREPPSFVAANNIIIMIVGLSILIVPVVGFLVCLCARTRVFQAIRELKLTAHDGQGVSSRLPYSHFDSESEETPKPKPKSGGAVPKDVRVLISSDNTVTGSPSKNSRITGTTSRVPMRSSVSSTSLVDDYNGVDATFIRPAVVETSSMEQYS